MKKREPVSKIMTPSPLSVNLSNDLEDVITIFKERTLHHVPVVSGDKLIGMISKTDIDRISFTTDYNNAETAVYSLLSVEQVMTKQVESVQKDDLIKEVAELFAKSKYHALPVLDGESLVGIVTTTDVINYLLEQY